MLLLAALILLWPMGGDFWVADQLYAWQGHQWSLRQSWLTEAMVHKAGKQLSTLVWVVVFALWIASYFHRSLRRWRQPLLYLTVSVALSTALISLLKHLTDMDCPWDLQRYGGLRPYIGLLDTRPDGLARGQCFPAGHASAGYAWLCLYFFFAMVKPSWRGYGLLVGLLAGGVFGISQQLRGAHFLSHDITTATLCWTVAVLTYIWISSSQSAQKALSTFSPHAAAEENYDV